MRLKQRQIGDLEKVAAAQPLRLHERGQDNTRGQLLEGVVLKFFPELGVPPLPDLMPVVLLATP